MRDRLPASRGMGGDGGGHPVPAQQARSAPAAGFDCDARSLARSASATSRVAGAGVESDARTQHMPTHLLALDQGTTSSRSILFDGTDIVAVAQREFTQHF